MRDTRANQPAATTLAAGTLYFVTDENVTEQSTGAAWVAYSRTNAFAASGIVIGTAKIINGTGSPEGVVTAPIGSVFLRTDGGASTTLYIKTSGAGNTGWTAK